MSTLQIIIMVVLLATIIGMAVLAAFSNVVASAVFFLINFGLLFLYDVISKLVMEVVRSAVNKLLAQSPAGPFLAIGLSQACALVVVLFLFVFLNLIILLFYFAIFKRFFTRMKVDKMWYEITSRAGAVVFGFGTGLVYAIMLGTVFEPIADVQNETTQYNENKVVKFVNTIETNMIPHLKLASFSIVNLKEYLHIFNNISEFFDFSTLKNLFNEDNPVVKDAVVKFVNDNFDKIIHDNNIESKIQGLSLSEKAALKSQLDKFSSNPDFLKQVQDIFFPPITPPTYL